MANETAQNIANAVTNKAAGISPKTDKPEVSQKGDNGTSAVDPNAGKEKYVVDGKDRYLTPEEAKAYVQKGLAFEPKVSELSRLQQETALFIQTLRNDPAKVLFNPQFGDPQQVLEKIMGSTKVSDAVKTTIGQWYYNNVIVPEKMTPEQRETAQLKREAEEFRTYKQQQEDARIEKENQSKIQQAMGLLKSQINEAMKAGGLPVDSKIAPQMASRIAKVILLAQRMGKTLTPAEAYQTARKELKDYKTAFYDSLNEDQLVEELGKENAEKVRKYFVKKLKEKQQGKQMPKGSSAPSPKREERKTMNSDQFREYLDGLKQKGK
jgi:hypothetical protein